jgi:hypothetical protein
LAKHTLYEVLYICRENEIVQQYSQVEIRYGVTKNLNRISGLAHYKINRRKTKWQKADSQEWVGEWAT